MTTNVYVDGFNLYYRALKGRPFRWLDLCKLSEVLFPRDTIKQVCYFTALLDARPSDPAQPQRQQVYLRALATLPNLEVYYGTFRSRTKHRPLVKPIVGLPEIVEVRDSEEEGSDVNLVTRLLVDGFNGEYEQAVVISNDSDFASAIRYVRDSLHLRVTVVNPDRKNRTHKDLKNAATYVKRLWKSHLRQSQFPHSLADAHGTIRKPNSWK
ncbi:MAG: NYN domain-containing protein [Chloroflexota bacterium]|nr:NYN domain-containing protein [Chloroflexota bacterium]MDE2839740.1 NYN domain-containing protein [Chloroflexota bacterium]MDE2929434.1 NYN domain-containing protein [Chloroflexota bacterium]